MLSPQTQYSNIIPFHKDEGWYRYKQELSWKRNKNNENNVDVSVKFIHVSGVTGNCPYKSIKILYRIDNGTWNTIDVVQESSSTYFAPDDKTFGDENTPITISGVSLDSDFEIKSITKVNDDVYFIAPIPNGYKQAELYIYGNIINNEEKWNPAMPYIYGSDGEWHIYTIFINNNT